MPGSTQESFCVSVGIRSVTVTSTTGVTVVVSANDAQVHETSFDTSKGVGEEAAQPWTQSHWTAYEREIYARGAADERERIATMAEEWAGADMVDKWPYTVSRFLEFAAALREFPADAQESVNKLREELDKP